MMGTQQRNSDHHHHHLHHHHQNQQGVIQSSIALLQERFKHLQRVKEMREKRELLKIFSNNTHNNIENNNNTTTTTTSATVLTTSTTTSNTHNIIPRDSTMPYTYHHHHHHDGDHDHGTDQKDQLQVFLPPNYYNCKPTSCHTSPPSSQSSPSSSSTASPSSSWSSSSESNKEVALSLWPSTPPCKITAVNNINITAAADPFQRTTSSSFLRPIKEDTMVMNRGCLSRAFRFEDAHHVSDVDTTLHL